MLSQTQIALSRSLILLSKLEWKGKQIVDYIIVFLTLVMVGLYALAIGWLLPKH